MEELLSVEGLVSLATLTFLEIILGIDNSHLRVFSHQPDGVVVGVWPGP